MKSACIFVLLLIALALVNCKKKKKRDEISAEYSNSSESYYDSYPNNDDNSIFDLTGHVMKAFVFLAASFEPTKSLVCSPFSGLLPLGKLAFGATDSTLFELLEAIGVKSLKNVEKRFKELLHDVKKLKGVTLLIASRIYLNKDKKLETEFKNKTKKVFKSSVELVDVNDPTAVVETVNKWVEKQTNNMIRGLLIPRDIKPDMNVLLVNAVHFKGKWKFPFREEFSDTFQGIEGNSSMVMMRVTDTFKYGESQILGSKVIEMPYQGSDAKFMIVLPNSRHGLLSLMTQLRLAPKLLNKLKMNQTRVQLTVPKFTIESEIDLSLLYQYVGLHDIFNPFEGLKKMVKGERVKVDMAKQKAIIEVTRDGTEAAAASVVAVGMGYAPSIPFEVKHPFLYFIVANKQQLFAGVFTGL